VKKALHLIGMIEDELRLPLVEMTAEGTENLKNYERIAH